MSKSVTVPIFNHEYKVVVCWGSATHLKKVLSEHYYPKDALLDEHRLNRRGVTFINHRCYPVIWIDANLAVSDALGTLAHEAVHAVESIFEAIEEDLRHSEIFSHAVGAVVRETVKAMKLKSTQERK